MEIQIKESIAARTLVYHEDGIAMHEASKRLLEIERSHCEVVENTALNLKLDLTSRRETDSNRQAVQLLQQSLASRKKK